MKKTITILAAMLMVLNVTKAQWVNLGELTHPLSANNIIYSVVTDVSGNVYAAGKFSIGDSSVQYYVAKWTGDTAWTLLDTADFKANGYIYTLATDHAGDIYAAGAFTDGHVTTSGGEVYFYGNIYVAKYNGTTWSELGTGGLRPVPNVYGSAILSIALDPTGNVYAAGTFTNPSDKYYVSKWNGTAWTELRSGSNTLNANNFINTIATDPQGNVYAAGDFTDASGTRYVAKWNGTNWTELGSLNANSPIRTITTDATGNLYVGYQDTASNFFVAEWDGTNWNQVGTGSNALNANNSINALTTDASGNLYAAGNFTDPNGLQYVAKWNDTIWTELGTGSNLLQPNGYILTIATDASNDVYAAGYFSDGYNTYYVAEYDPNTQGPSGVNSIKLSGIDGMDILPNPTSGQANIVLTASSKSDISITVYDMTGRPVTDLYDGSIEAGQERIVFDTDKIASGIYIIKVSEGSSFIQKRFVKI